MSGRVWRRATLVAAGGALALAPVVPAQHATTVLVVRHTEKVSDASDAVLSDTGWQRAAELLRVTQDAGVSAVFASQYVRAQQTLQPIADSRGLEIQVHDAGDSAGLARRILANHAGEVVIVSGHSNTVPDIVAALGAPRPGTIEDWDYDDLFVVTIGADGARSVVRLSYGEASVAPER